MIPAAVDYLRAGSLEEALGALRTPEAKALAGGHSLVPMLKLRMARPDLLVDISRLPLGGIAESDGSVELGALATWDEIAASPRVPVAVRECAGAVGDLQVRNWGTIGGGSAHADPAADIPAALLAFGATMRLRSREGTREVPVEEFFLGPFTTALAEEELLISIRVPQPAQGEGSAYAAIKDPASGYPLAGAAACVSVENGRIASCAVALTGIAGRAFRARDVEERLLGSGPEDLDGATRDAFADVEVLDEARVDRAYRRHLGRVVVRRAVQRAREAAGR